MHASIWSRVALAAALAASGGSAVSVSGQPLTSGPTFDGPVYAEAFAGDTLYVGGDFQSAIVNGHKTGRVRLAAVNARTGALLPWAPKADGVVRALAVDPTGVYVAGDFTAVGGQPRAGLARVDPTTGAVGPFHPALTGHAGVLALGGSRLYVGGTITAVDGRPVSNLVAFRTGTAALDPGFAATTDDTVESLGYTPGRLYVGGLFHTVDGQPGMKLAAVFPDTGARDPAFQPHISVVVHGIAVGPAGIFTALGGQGGRVVAFDPSGSPVWTATLDGDVQAVAYLAGVVYLGGHFDNACVDNLNGVHGVCTDGSESRVKLAALDASAGTWLPWAPQANGVHGVFAMAASADPYEVAAGGEFTLIGGVSRKHLAQFGG